MQMSVTTLFVDLLICGPGVDLVFVCRMLPLRNAELGYTWSQTIGTTACAPNAINWISIASSSSGQNLAAVVSGVSGGIWTSQVGGDSFGFLYVAILSRPALN